MSTRRRAVARERGEHASSDQHEWGRSNATISRVAHARACSGAAFGWPGHAPSGARPEGPEGRRPPQHRQPRPSARSHEDRCAGAHDQAPGRTATLRPPEPPEPRGRHAARTMERGRRTTVTLSAASPGRGRRQRAARSRGWIRHGAALPRRGHGQRVLAAPALRRRRPSREVWPDRHRVRTRWGRHSGSPAAVVGTRRPRSERVSRVSLSAEDGLRPCTTGCRAAYHRPRPTTTADGPDAREHRNCSHARNAHRRVGLAATTTSDASEPSDAAFRKRTTARQDTPDTLSGSPTRTSARRRAELPRPNAATSAEGPLEPREPAREHPKIAATTTAPVAPQTPSRSSPTLVTRSPLSQASVAPRRPSAPGLVPCPSGPTRADRRRGGATGDPRARPSPARRWRGSGGEPTTATPTAGTLPSREASPQGMGGAGPTRRSGASQDESPAGHGTR